MKYENNNVLFLILSKERNNYCYCHGCQFMQPLLDCLITNLELVTSLCPCKFKLNKYRTVNALEIELFACTMV